MRSLKLALLYGFAVWAIPFIVAVFIYPIHESNRPLFESVMPVAITVSAIIFTVLYLKKAAAVNYLAEGAKLGLIWLVVSIGIDLLMFSRGPMKMSLSEYTADIGVAYLMIPVITIGCGYLLENQTRSARRAASD